MDHKDMEDRLQRLLGSAKTASEDEFKDRVKRLNADKKSVHHPIPDQQELNNNIDAFDLEFGDDIMADFLNKMEHGGNNSLSHRVMELVSQVQDEVRLEQDNDHEEDEMASWGRRLKNLSEFKPTLKKSHTKNAENQSVAITKSHVEDTRKSIHVEDQFCCICSEDPTWICPSCDGDLYCGRCFQGYHQSSGDYETSLHRPVALNSTKSHH